MRVYTTWNIQYISEQNYTAQSNKCAGQQRRNPSERYLLFRSSHSFCMCMYASALFHQNLARLLLPKNIIQLRMCSICACVGGSISSFYLHFISYFSLAAALEFLSFQRGLLFSDFGWLAGWLALPSSVCSPCVCVCVLMYILIYL